MTRTSVSVVVVSRARPDALTRCISGLAQVQYQPFEIIVVADPSGIEAVEKLDCAESLKLVPFDTPNISAARNAGIDVAAGDIVAFIDDDAVPEPTWLHYLIAPFEQSDVAATGGFVIGRNGISFQWKSRMINALGHTTPIEIPQDHATVLHPPKGSAVKTEGTNMAVRRDVLAALGGFDPAYHFYLDETDLNMRLAQAGHATALCPRALVHHGFAASTRRRKDRVPADLFDIGASWAVFARKIIPETERRAHWAEIVRHERKRLLSHMVAGALEPRQVRHLMRRLQSGHKEGGKRDVGTGKLTSHASDAFRAFPVVSRSSSYILATPLTVTKKRKQALDRVKNGEIVTLIVLSRSSMYHHVRFTESGVWEQTGGQFGRATRSSKRLRWVRREVRFKDEIDRVVTIRGFGDAKLPL